MEISKEFCRLADTVKDLFENEYYSTQFGKHTGLCKWDVVEELEVL